MNKGKIIAFSGVDGAGKSTQSKLLSAKLSKKGYTAKTTEFAFGYFLLKPIIRYLRKITGSPTGGPVNRNTNNLAKLWFVPAFIDLWLGYFFVLKPMVNRYDYILADRFYTDVWANMLYYGYIPRWAFRYLIRFLPKPDTAFLFILRPKSAQKRASEFPLSYYTTQTGIYRQLTTLTKPIVVKADANPQAISSVIAKKLGLD